MQFLFYFAVTALLSTFTMAYMGIFRKLKASYSKIGPYKVLFKQCLGDIDSVGSQFKKMEEVTRKVFKHTDSFGIYYDNPSIVLDKSQMRSVIGIILTNYDAEGSKVERFLKKHKEFTFKDLPQINGFKVSFPYRNSMSYIIGPKRAYPALNQQMQNLEAQDMDKYVGALEIVKPGNRRIIDFCFLIDESVTEGNDSKYWLTTQPQPEYKKNSDDEDDDEDEIDEDGEDEEDGEEEEGDANEEDGDQDEDEIGESDEEDDEEHQGLKNQNILENVLTESAEKKKK